MPFNGEYVVIYPNGDSETRKGFPAVEQVKRDLGMRDYFTVTNNEQHVFCYNKDGEENGNLNLAASFLLDLGVRGPCVILSLHDMKKNMYNSKRREA